MEFTRIGYSQPTRTPVEVEAGADASISFTNQRVQVRHPGYNGNNILITLPAAEGRSPGHAHAATVHTACAVLANNRFDGWLSNSAGYEDAEASMAAATFLPAGLYYFHVPSTDGNDQDPYPIVPNFRSWIFPHSQVPVEWHQAAETHMERCSISTGEGRCRLTNFRRGVQSSHVIPSMEKSWFVDNAMDQYGALGGRTGQDIVDTPVNLIRLRADVHHLWDQRDFSIVPRLSRDEQLTWAACVMTQDPELLELYHNVEVQSLAGLPSEFLLTRFAWDIFPTLLAFLQSSQPRVLAVRLPNGEAEIKRHDPHECRKFAEGQGPGRSSSPSKRQRKDLAEDATRQETSDRGIFKRQRTGTPLSVSFDSAVAGFDEGDCETSTIFGQRDEDEEREYVTSNAEKSTWWNDEERATWDEEPRGRKRRRTSG